MTQQAGARCGAATARAARAAKTWRAERQRARHGANPRRAARWCRWRRRRRARGRWRRRAAAAKSLSPPNSTSTSLPAPPSVSMSKRSHHEEDVAVEGAECAAGARAPASKLTIARRCQGSWAGRGQRAWHCASRCCSRIVFSAAYGSASFSAGTSTRWAPRRPLAALLVVRSPPCLAMREPRVWRSWRSRLALRIVWRARRQCAGSAPAVRQLQRLRSTQTPDCALGVGVRPEALEAPPLCLSLR